MAALDPKSVADLVKGLLGDVAKKTPIVGALIDLVTDEDVLTVITGMTATGIAELQAQFDSMRKLSPAARVALMDSMTPEMMNKVLDADRARIEKVELDQAKVDEAMAKAARKVVERVVTEAVRLLL